MEYLDILDENGNKTGEMKERKEVHTKGYWHKDVHICIVNNKKEILMQRRSSNKAIFPDKLDISVGGHPVSGENAIQCITRETAEELGIQIDASQLEYLLTFQNQYDNGILKGNEFIEVYLLEMDFNIDELKLDKKEVSEVIKVPYQDFAKMVDQNSEEIVPFFKGWKQLCEILNKKYLQKERNNI